MLYKNYLLKSTYVSQCILSFWALNNDTNIENGARKSTTEEITDNNLCSFSSSLEWFKLSVDLCE